MYIYAEDTVQLDPEIKLSDIRIDCDTWIQIITLLPWERFLYLCYPFVDSVIREAPFGLIMQSYFERELFVWMRGIFSLGE
jgi:hypothetical protein